MFVAVLNNKGGVGKSTIAVHAAVWLKERGVRLAVVDADAQASTSHWLTRAQPDIRVERCATVAEIRERLPRLSAVCDTVLADGPAALSAETAALAAAADLVLLPIGPSMMDVRASYCTARLLYHVRLRVHRGDHPCVVTVLNRVQSRTRLAQIALEAVRKYGFPVANSCLKLRQAYAEACGRGSVVWRMGTAAQKATIEIDRLFGEILNVCLTDPANLRAVARLPTPEEAAWPSSWPQTPGGCPRSLPLSAVLTASSPGPPIRPSPSYGPPGAPDHRDPCPSPSGPPAASSRSTPDSIPTD